MKSFKKISLIILIIFVLIISFIPTNSHADWDDWKKQADQFIEKGEKNPKLDDSEVFKVVEPIARILVNIATVVLVIVTVVMGIKYMTSNPEQQGKLKQQLIGLVVSTVVIFGAQLIWSLVYSFMSGL